MRISELSKFVHFKYVQCIVCYFPSIKLFCKKAHWITFKIVQHFNGKVWSHIGRVLGSLLTVTIYNFVYIFLRVEKGTLILKFGDVLHHLRFIP